MCSNRLTAVGSKRAINQFVKDQKWEKTLRAKHLELLESSRHRFVCQFETQQPPMKQLAGLSKRAPKLTLLLDYEVEKKRLKGLVKAKAGEIEDCLIHY